MLGQLFAPHRLTLGAFCRLDRCGGNLALGLGEGGLELLKKQRQLAGSLELLGGLPEAGAAQLGEQELQVLDLLTLLA